MINIKPVIVGALENDAELIALLGGTHIFHCGSVEEMQLPCVAYIELENEPLNSGDEIEVESIITYQFDIWQKPGCGTTDITMAINRIMKTLNGTREHTPDDDSQAPKECRVMVYSFIVDQEGIFY